ncbi:hypothetical protein [Aridibaculum aurantiacum]|uniref:hypothetical protein n=1 Tax=Aridibaculum aurantiacum TaxID=2810307 RepID=UPI001A96A3C6|nr:hypothetical protein [Aridibaculum aurantiacum]
MNKTEILTVTDFYTISLQEDWIYVDWTGFQLKNSVYAGCEKMLEILKQMKYSKILNDNTHVKGLWEHAWVANDWFPRIAEAGLKHFAWVLSPEELSASLAGQTAAITPAASCIKIFKEVDEAKLWLRSL